MIEYKPVICKSTALHKFKAIHLSIILSLLLCISQYFEISILNLTLTGSLYILVLTQKKADDCVVMLYTLLPMFNLLNYKVGTTSLYYLFVCIFWFRYIKHHSLKLKSSKLLVLSVLLIIRLTSGEIGSTLKWFILISVLVLTYQEDFFDSSIARIVFYMSITFITSSIFGYLMLQEGRSIYTRGYVWSEYGNTIRFAGVIGDSVFFSQFCALLVAANLTLGCYIKGYFVKSIFLSVPITVLCLYSYAKTGLLLIICSFIAVIFWHIWNKSQSRTTILCSVWILLNAFLGLSAIIIYVITHPENAVVKNYTARFNSTDLLTGRGEVWKHYIMIFINDWKSLFCAMSQSEFTKVFYLENGSTVNKTHNIYIETLCAFGFLATIFIFLWIIKDIIVSIKENNGILCLLPVFIILASGYSLHGHFEFHYYTLVSIALSFLKNNNNLKEWSNGID